LDGPFVYVCDLDGTLLRSDGSLSSFAQAALNHLLAQGAQLTVASSRSMQAMRAMLSGVEFRLPVIELNGAFISHLDSGVRVVKNVLAQPTAEDVMEMLLCSDVDPVLTAWDGARDRVFFGNRMNAGTEWYVEEKNRYGDPRLTPCDDLTGALDGAEVAAITTLVADAEASALVERLGDRFGSAVIVHCAQNPYCRGWTEIQIQDRGAEKGAAVGLFLEASGITGAEVIACGDHLIDLSLFRVAAHSVAPMNAHPDVLDAASETVGSNDDDAIVRWLARHYAHSGGNPC